mgnify:CR=1 FL=1
MMKKLYPKYEIIEDIGSGLNLNKRGIRRILKLAIDGKINELVIAYKDRLTRFGFELIENIINSNFIKENYYLGIYILIILLIFLSIELLKTIFLNFLPS